MLAALSASVVALSTSANAKCSSMIPLSSLHTTSFELDIVFLNTLGAASLTTKFLCEYRMDASIVEHFSDAACRYERSIRICAAC